MLHNDIWTSDLAVFGRRLRFKKNSCISLDPAVYGLDYHRHIEPSFFYYSSMCIELRTSKIFVAHRRYSLIPSRRIDWALILLQDKSWAFSLLPYGSRQSIDVITQHKFIARASQARHRDSPRDQPPLLRSHLFFLIKEKSTLARDNNFGFSASIDIHILL